MKIYIWCVGLGRGSTWGAEDVIGHALSEDGVGLGSHLSSSVGFAKHDMGITSNWHHETYRKYYPEGYVLEWLEDPETHAGWQAAMALNEERWQDPQMAKETADAAT